MAIWLGIALDAIPESIVIGIAILGMAASISASGVEPTFLDVLPTHLLLVYFYQTFLKHCQVQPKCKSKE